MALTDKLTAIANAIRTKSGGTDFLTLDEMVTAISGITGIERKTFQITDVTQNLNLGIDYVPDHIIILSTNEPNYSENQAFLCGFVSITDNVNLVESLQSGQGVKQIIGSITYSNGAITLKDCCFTDNLLNVIICRQ